MGDLTTTARIKGALQIPAGVTIHDARLDELVGEVEAELLARTTLTAWGTTSHSEYLDGRSSTDVLMLRRFPVVAVAAVTVVGDTSALVYGEDYDWQDCGVIRRIPEGTGWPQGSRKVVVTYQTSALNAGATPGDLIGAATMLAARRYVLDPMAGLSDAELQPMRRTTARWTDDLIQIEVDRALARYRSAL